MTNPTQPNKSQPSSSQILIVVVKKRRKRWLLRQLTKLIYTKEVLYD